MRKCLIRNKTLDFVDVPGCFSSFVFIVFFASFRSISRTICWLDFGEVFDQIFGQGFDQGLWEGKNHKYRVQYFPAEGKSIQKTAKKSNRSFD